MPLDNFPRPFRRESYWIPCPENLGHLKGTITTGKYADLAVLSADYFDVDAADISRIESMLTIVGGKIVWSSAEFEGLAAPLPDPAPAWSPVTEFGGFRDPARGVG